MDNNNECCLIDTKAFNNFISQKESLLKKYDDINAKYDKIVRELLDNWVGEGADNFRSDAQKVKANITGIYDILKLMCDTLTDCEQIFKECDKTLGDYNQNPNGEETT